jgi:hypothetical protein
MTELEWLKQESGLADEEWTAMAALGGSAKLLTGIKKALGLSEQALKDKVAAENQRIEFENRYNNEFVPEMRKVTTDALRATGEAARLKAELDQARQYGIVPEPETKTPVEPPRAPGSPDPNAISRDDFGRFSQQQASTIITLQDLNAEHFKLFGQPLGNTQALVDEVQRQRTLGNKDFTIKKAWETTHNVEAKRQEIQKAERQKEIDAAVSAARKEDREKAGANPHLRTGQQSRFSKYSPTDSSKEPWKAPRSVNERNRNWRQEAVSKVREHIAA